MARVELFSLDGCPYCDEARSFLRERGIRFKDSRLSPASVRRLEESGRIKFKRRGGSVELVTPVICSSDKCVVGFSKKSVEKLLGL